MTDADRLAVLEQKGLPLLTNPAGAEFSPCRTWRYTLWRTWDAVVFGPRNGVLMPKLDTIRLLTPSVFDREHDLLVSFPLPPSGRMASATISVPEGGFAMPAKLIDLSGQRFGRLVVMAREGNKWVCHCDCGRETRVEGISLRSGRTRSCGCFKRDVEPEVNRTHGMTRSGAWRSWVSMRQRCLDRQQPAWPRYGGRGITISPEWMSFENFYADMGDRPVGMSLDRIDVDGGYSRENCRWATITTQARNKRTNRRISYQGRTLTLVEWANKFGLSSGALASRLARHNGSVDAVFSRLAERRAS